MPAEHSNLENVRKRAKSLLKSFNGGDQTAVDAFRHNHPHTSLRVGEAKLSDAQLVLARDSGHQSWPEFADHLSRQIVNEAVSDLSEPDSILDEAFFDALVDESDRLQKRGALRPQIKTLRAGAANVADILLLASCLELTGDMAECVAIFRQVEPDCKNSASFYRRLGDVLAAMSRTSEASVVYEKATSLNPRYGLAYHNHAMLFQNTDLHKCSDLLSKAVAAQPDSVRNRMHFAMVLTRQGFHEESVPQLVAALEHGPYRDVIALLGKNLVLLGRVEQAQRTIKQYILQLPNRLHQATIYARLAEQTQFINKEACMMWVGDALEAHARTAAQNGVSRQLHSDYQHWLNS